MLLYRAAAAALLLIALCGCSAEQWIRFRFAERGATPAEQDEAVAVAWCESRLNPAARNGEYLGLFQLGHYHYDRPGMDAPLTAAGNAAAAADLWVEAGWTPWSCRP